MISNSNKTIDKSELADIRNIVIDTSKPVPERVKSYNEQIGNRKCFLYEDTVVHVSFMDAGPCLKDRIKQYLLSGQGAGLISA